MKKLTIEEKLQKLANETKELKAKKKEEKREAQKIVFSLLGEAIYLFFEKEEKEGKSKKEERIKDYAEKLLTQNKVKKLNKALEKL